ncbi:unnamed protein product [Larinioides sclopetarius]
MGIIFFHGCEGDYPYTDPILTILMGIFGLFLIYKWMVKVRRHRSGGYYWNDERNRLIIYMVIFMFLTTLEFLFFSHMSPKTPQSKLKVKCTKTFYDYLHYMHIANAACLVFVALLYLPDCCIYIYSYERMLPSPANGHYQPL